MAGVAVPALSDVTNRLLKNGADTEVSIKCGRLRLHLRSAILVSVGSLTLCAMSAAPAQAAVYDRCGVLSEGSAEVECVRQVQQDVNTIDGNDLLPVTGVFGPMTREAVIAFQQRNGLPSTGNVGDLTKAKLTELAHSGNADGAPGGDRGTNAPRTWHDTSEAEGASASCTTETSETNIHDDLATIDCTLADTAADSHPVYVQWWQDGFEKSRLENHDGANSTKSVSDRRSNGAGSFAKVSWQVCRDVQLGSDDCSPVVTHDVPGAASPDGTASVPQELFRTVEAAPGSVPVKPGLGRYRAGFFIMQDAYGPPIINGGGDDRSFDEHMGEHDNRVYVDLDYEHGVGRVIVAPSCDVSHVNCVQPVDLTDARISITRDNSAIFPSEVTKVHINIENSRWKLDGLMRIRAELQFAPTPQGTFMVTGSMSRFPSFELYRDRPDGVIDTIYQHEQAKRIGAPALGAPGLDISIGCNVGPEGVDGKCIG